MRKIVGLGLVAFAWRFLLLSSIYGTFYTAAQGGGSFDERRLQQISQSMNPKLKMCGDFYSYACENWQGPELIKILEEKIQGDTLEILEQLYRASEPKFLRELYQYYEAYKEVENPQPMEYLKWLRVYENMQWSLMENKTMSGEKPWKWNVDWLELLAKLRQFGFNDLFFQEDVIQSKEDPYKGVVELKIPDLSYLYDFEQQVYILGDLIDESLVESLAEFQAELSKVTLELVHSEESDDFNYRYLDMASSSRVEGKLVALKDLYMPWLNKYLQLILQQTPLDPNMQIQVQSVKYLKRIYSFLSKYDNQMLCDYIQIKFLIFLMKDDRIHYKMDAVNNIRKNFPMILQWIHGRIHKELPRDVGVVQRLFSNLKENFKKVLQSKASTLPSSLMEYMMAKLNTLELVVLDKSPMELEFYYGSLSFLSTEYYGNRLRLNRFKFQKQHSKLQKVYPRNSLEYLDIRPTGSDKKDYPYPLPLLYPRLNIISLPLTLLQEPFYQTNMGELFSYSSLGYLLAHELTKAFDSQHLKIDAQGIEHTVLPGRKPKSVEDTEDDDEDDFSKDPVIDDLAGLNLAYTTFARDHAVILPQVVTLPNKAALSMEKVFFLNYAQLFCSSFCGFHPMADFHSYDACARVNTPVRHSVVFRQAFSCGALSEEDVAEFALLPKPKGGDMR